MSLMFVKPGAVSECKCFINAAGVRVCIIMKVCVRTKKLNLKEKISVISS